MKRSLLVRRDAAYELGGVLALTVMAVVTRFQLLDRNTVPGGSDPGNLLAMAACLTGRCVTQLELVSPPIPLLLLNGLLLFLDPFMALKVVGTISGALPTVPFYLVSRMLGGRVPALITTLMFMFITPYLDLVGWGAYSQLLGFFFMFLAIYFLLVLIQKPSRKNASFAAIATALTIGAHHLTGVILVLTLVPSAAVHILTVRSSRSHIALFAILTFAFSLPFAPFYYNLSTNLLVTASYVGARGGGLNLLFQLLAFLFREPPLLWPLLTGIAVLYLIIPRLQPSWLPSRVLLAGLTSIALIPFSLVQAHPLYLLRFLYFIFIPIILLFGVFIRDVMGLLARVAFQRRFLRAFVLTGLVFPAPYIAVSSLAPLENMPELYNYVKPDILEGLNWIKANTSPKDIIATTGKENLYGHAYGWWIRGYSERRTLMTSDPPYFHVLQKERQETHAAMLAFLSSDAGEMHRALKMAEVSYIFMPKPNARLLAMTDEAPLLFKLVFQNSQVGIYKVL